MNAAMKKISPLKLFLGLTTLHMLATCWGFFSIAAQATTGAAVWFHVCAWLFYSFAYAVVTLIPAWLQSLLARTINRYTALLALTFSVIGILLVRSDLMIYDLYNFHFNGFIWNLVTTKGGLASLGTSDETYVAIGISVAIVILIQLLAWWLSTRMQSFKPAVLLTRPLYLVVLLAFVAQAVLYGISDVKNNGAILDSATVYPFYKRITFRSWAEKMGVQTVRHSSNHLNVDTSRIQYPLSPVTFSAVQQPPNIVILVAESLRWDRLTPEIMPHVWQFAQQGLYFKNHYSSGNGTREGLFGMFYGLYGSYWSSFLHAQQPPLLMQRVQALNYQLDLRTSALFSYPEFNKTLFASVPLAQLHEAEEKLTPWQRDQQNASEQIAFLRARDKQRPFMSFFFFESTHARYDFPEQAVIASPYLKDVNYWGMSRESLKPKIGEFKNRYTNAAHWVDQQMGRVLDELRAQGALDNTIVIITGDHGEEFLEKGFWGHNSSFVEEQTHTPMVVWMPQHAHAEIERMTSHLDISPTLLQALGAPEDSSSYSLGLSLLTTQSRPFVVVSDWHSIGVQTTDMKYRIPYLHHGVDHFVPTGPHDESLSASAQDSLMAKYQPLLLQAIQNCSRFLALHKDKAS